MGMPIEVGVVADIAMLLFWALGDHDWPTSFIRGTFGLKTHVGGELAGLLGFAFANTTHDIFVDAVAVDSDLAPGLWGAGMAWIANTNGLSSFEFVFGPGIGFSLIGVACAITAELDEAPSMAEWIVPSLKPTHVPTTRPPTPVPTTVIPTRSLSSVPSLVPSKPPSRVPSKAPSPVPSKVPSEAPS